ncbi:hypothetical protein ES705_01171 [subsurface metagenome]|nr:transposase [Clostridia bacterium]
MIRYSAGWKHLQITLENVYSYLKEKKISCLLLNPYQVKKYRQALGLKIRTDSVDAEAVAQLIRAKKYDDLYISDEVAVELKELVRIKFSFARRAKDLKKGVMSLFCLVFPEYTRIISHPFSKVSTEILSKYPTSCHMTRPVWQNWLRYLESTRGAILAQVRQKS